MRPSLMLSALLLAATPVFAGESAATAEEVLARKPLEAYLQAHATGDGELIRAAFLPTARIDGVRDGKPVSRTTEEFASGFSGKPAADEAQRRRRIDAVAVHGNAGMARVTLEYPKVTFTDYFVLLKVDGEWKIASKVYDAAPK